ncbi:hypothetical protein SAY86_000318 [Trapa natans]|uniref:Uncharacterized protein n=1 Tax=Trapa natans TaxID=22666 RepID=A0AAN7RGI7_TRANT|nr:hypothetical protein SAY86_000318 [Trapa natans]
MRKIPFRGFNLQVIRRASFISHGFYVALLDPDSEQSLIPSRMLPLSFRSVAGRVDCCYVYWTVRDSSHCVGLLPVSPILSLEKFRRGRSQWLDTDAGNAAKDSNWTVGHFAGRETPMLLSSHSGILAKPLELCDLIA